MQGEIFCSGQMEVRCPCMAIGLRKFVGMWCLTNKGTTRQGFDTCRAVSCTEDREKAIATMVSLRNTGGTHFVVVCPASVITNWCREIRKDKWMLWRIYSSGRYRLVCFRKSEIMSNLLPVCYLLIEFQVFLSVPIQCPHNPAMCQSEYRDICP